MRKLLIAAAAAATVLSAAAAPQKAEAAIWLGGVKIPAVTADRAPVEGAACRGWGRWCGPGFVRACGPYRCWCRPCY